MSPRISHKQHIERRDDVCDGRPCIVGTGIRVQDVYVWHELQRRTPEQIVSEHPQLTVADIHSALAYYFDHRDEIQRDMTAAEKPAVPVPVEQGPDFLERLRARITAGESTSS
jgi:uncharacterized protein (DUF433 family)